MANARIRRILDWRDYLAKDSQAWDSCLTNLREWQARAEQEALRALEQGHLEAARTAQAQAAAFRWIAGSLEGYKREEQEYLLYMSGTQNIADIGETNELVVE